jgi:CheY-like chemotaxis protein
MTYDLTSVRVLVVDDDEEMRRLLRKILRTIGVVETMTATNGVDALDAMRRETVDIVITDWSMTPIDGVELIRRIRDLENSPLPFVPVILLTAYAEPARVAKARDAGVNEVLVKPVSPKALYDRLVHIIENPRSFVRTKAYFGPDRRRKDRPIEGPNRRQREAAPPKGDRKLPRDQRSGGHDRPRHPNRP